MLVQLLFAASLAAPAMGSAANICVQEPYRHMQRFRGHAAAIDLCELHYPIPTITKTLSNVCLTTTMTNILGTTTIRATNHLPCPTVHLGMRSEEGLKKHELTKEEEERRRRHRFKHHPTTKTKTIIRTRTETHTHDRTRTIDRTHIHSGPETTRTKVHDTTRTHDRTETHTRTHTHYRTRTIPESREPKPTGYKPYKRDLAEFMAARNEDWTDYYTELVGCGYECIQQACACVASPRIELQTPVPTCTSTKTKETVVHKTETLDVEPTAC